MIRRFMSKVNLWLNIWCNRTQTFIERMSYILECSKNRVFIFCNFRHMRVFTLDLINWFYVFPCVFNVFKIRSEIIIIIPSFTFFYYLLWLRITYFCNFYILYVNHFLEQSFDIDIIIIYSWHFPLQ